MRGSSSKVATTAVLLLQASKDGRAIFRDDGEQLRLQ
jgi:hypothetical protein